MQTTAYDLSNKGLDIQIPESIVQAIRLPENRIKEEILVELSLALYSQDMISFGKARELAGSNYYEFAMLLGKRGIYRHYGKEEFEDDLIYAHNQ